MSERNSASFGAKAIGLERIGFTPEQVSNINAAFRLLLQSRLNTSQAVDAIRQKNPAPEVEVLLKFIETSQRGVIK